MPTCANKQRDNEPWLETEEFEERIADLFRRPSELVFGSETANQARERYARCVKRALDAHRDETVVVVAHGTVISLYIAGVTGRDPLALWQLLGLPSYVALTGPEMRVTAVVSSVARA